MRLTSFRPIGQVLGGLRWLGRRLAGMRRSAAATIIAGLAVLIAIAATISWGVATAGNDELVGNNVTNDQLTAIVSAARSCPMLTPARVAGQLMEESGLDPNASSTRSGGQGIAGLNDSDWQRWSPWPDAERGDAAANILALGHDMCDLSGQLRLQKTPGDDWQLALAAFHSSLTSVVNARAVPSSAADYIKAASGYAAYYASLPAFGGSGPAPTASTSAVPTDAKQLPDQYVQPVLAAGRVCQQVSPAAVAALLMSASKFDPNMLGANGAQGIAQFLPEVWQQYAPPGASVWDPNAAIPVLGTALCGMISELAGLPGDPYQLALAGFRVGPTAVRQTDGTPDADTAAFIEKVAAYTGYYRLDTRLSASAPPATASSSPSAKPSATTKPTPPAKTAKPEPTHTKAAPPPPLPPLPGQSIVQEKSHKCIDAALATDGTHLTLQTCSSGTKSQRWYVESDGTIRSVLTGLCMDIANAQTADGTLVQTANCSGNPAQQWTVNAKNEVLSPFAKRCIDSVGDNPTNGTGIDIWTCVANDKQTWTVK